MTTTERRIKAAWRYAVGESGYGLGNQLLILIDFIVEAGEKNPSVVADFKSYLRDLYNDDAEASAQEEQGGLMQFYFVYDQKTRTHREANLDEYARQPHSERVLVKDTINGCLISTVFLGLDHQFGQGPPILYEMMVFTGVDYGDDLFQERYSSASSALEGHQRAVAWVRETQAKGE